MRQNKVSYYTFIVNINEYQKFGCLLYTCILSYPTKSHGMKQLQAFLHVGCWDRELNNKVYTCTYVLDYFKLFITCFKSQGC